MPKRASRCTPSPPQADASTTQRRDFAPSTVVSIISSSVVIPTCLATPHPTFKVDFRHP
jgi:hypothetical protein